MTHLRQLFMLTLVTLLCIAMPAFAVEIDTKAAAELKASVPQLIITENPERGTARHIASPDSLLTGPSGVGKSVRKQAPAGPHQAVRGFLNNYPTLLGGDENILKNAEIIRDHSTDESGFRTVVWRQLLEGIPVHGGELIANTTLKEELISIGSGFVPAPDRSERAIAQRANTTASPEHTAADAVSALLTKLDAPGFDATVTNVIGGPTQVQILSSTGAKGDIRAELVWFPVTNTDLHLGWRINVTEKTNGIMYAAIVDVKSLEVLSQVRLTSNGWYNPKQLQQRKVQPAAINQKAINAVRGLDFAPARNIATKPHVITSNNTSQNVAKALVPLRMRVFPDESPDKVAHTLVDIVYDVTASPEGWLNGFLETRGNNVDAHTDLDANDEVSGVDLPRPKGTGTNPVVFDFPADLTKAPSTYRPAAVVNLFYWCNRVHDRLYGLGFTETAGNFQVKNFNRGGLGNDAVEADAQDGSGTNNANMATDVDGIPPRMQMFIFTGPNPDRDSCFDASVIIHEYVHGLTHRLVAGGVSGNLDALQSGGMGEGWSDFYALSFLSKETDGILDAKPIGPYIIDDPLGIRTQLYGVEQRTSIKFNAPDQSTNTLTLNSVLTNTEVHFTGEVWCQVLWECRGEMIAKYGYAVGNELMLRLVTSGLRLTPVKPNFIAARDAIIQADLIANAGANSKELWRAFAKRGFGRAATAGSSSNVEGVAESFENSDLFRVSNAAGLRSTGRLGNLNSATAKSTTFVLTNPSSDTINWNVSQNASWFTMIPVSGSIPPGGTQYVTCNLTSNAMILGSGTWLEYLTFTDLTHNITVVRPVKLRLIPTYGISTSTSASYWVDNTGHTPIPLGDDTSSGTIGIPFQFPFYDVRTNQIFVGSNGLIGFATNVDLWSPYNLSLPTKSSLPYYGHPEPTNIAAALWMDLNPAGRGPVTIGTIGLAGSRKTIITYPEIPPFYALGSPMTFQVILEEATGDVVMNYKEVQLGDITWGQGRRATIGLQEITGTFADQFSYNTASLNNNMQVRFHPNSASATTNDAPTITIAASAGAFTGNSCPMSVLATDDGGEPALTYTWSFNGSPTSYFHFNPNGNNSAKNTIATFTKAGVFEVTATATDIHGLSASSVVTVTVPQILTSLIVTPNPATIPNLTTQAFTVTGIDQFGDIIPGTPTVTWSVISGTGSIDGAGVYTATNQGVSVVQAQNGPATGTATVNVTNGIPYIVVAANASPNPVNGTTTNLSVQGADDVDTGVLIYTWSAVGTVPAPVVFTPNGTNGAQNSVATFSKAGTYTLRVTISDTQGGSITSDVVVVVNQVNSGVLAIDPRNITMEVNTTQTFVARTGDQFGDPISSTPTRIVVWSTDLGSITAAGEFTAPSGPGIATIQAVEGGGATATSTVTIIFPDNNNGRFGGGTSSTENKNCGLGSFAAVFLLLLAFSGYLRRLKD